MKDEENEEVKVDANEENEIEDGPVKVEIELNGGGTLTIGNGVGGD